MEGITILNEIQKTAAPDWMAILGLTLCFLGLVSIIIYAASEKMAVAMTSIVIFIIIIIWTISFCIANSTIYDHTEYKVIIDDSVNFNEFNEKYEIVDTDGKIYTIKEKED
jgi:hypothetical protein